MAQPDRVNVTPLAARRERRELQGEHAWLVPHLISLIGYAERHGLSEVELALTQAAERIAPRVQPTARAEGPPAERLVFLNRSRPDGATEG